MRHEHRQELQRRADKHAEGIAEIRRRGEVAVAEIRNSVAAQVPDPEPYHGLPAVQLFVFVDTYNKSRFGGPGRRVQHTVPSAFQAFAGSSSLEYKPDPTP